MNVGDQKEFVIPPELAYGKRGQAPYIEGGASLRFWVQLKSHEIDPASLDENTRAKISAEKKLEGNQLFKD